MRLALNLLWLTPMRFHAYQRGRIWLIFTDSDCATGSFQRKMADEEKKNVRHFSQSREGTDGSSGSKGNVSPCDSTLIP